MVAAQIFNQQAEYSDY